MANQCKGGFKKVKGSCTRMGGLRANTNMNRTDVVFLWVLVIEALFLSAFGLFSFNPVSFMDATPLIANIFYLLFFIAPIYLIVRIFMGFK